MKIDQKFYFPIIEDGELLAIEYDGEHDVIKLLHYDSKLVRDNNHTKILELFTKLIGHEFSIHENEFDPITENIKPGIFVNGS